MPNEDHTPDAETPAVLIVDDEARLADLYAAWLGATYTVQTAYSGEAALRMLDASIDVILLDRRMPDLSGDEVLAELRNQGLDCRVVIVSAVTPDFDVIGMGFDEYLTKPIGADELKDTIERMLGRAEYDEGMHELQQLVATRAALDANKSTVALQTNPEYVTLTERIADLQDEIDATISEFSQDDFEAALHDLTPGERDSTGDSG